MGRPVEWWRTAATHMWWKYFEILRTQELINTDIPPLSDADARIFTICDRLYHNSFSQQDQNILRTYFSCGWGDDLRTVSDYSRNNNVPVSAIWIVVKRAGRMAM